jgi:multiple antibiotic resistance protein
MRPILILFVSTFSTLLAIINPLEALPIYLALVEGKAVDEQRRIARRACFYAVLLLFFFLVFGVLIMRIFGVSMGMVRFVGGIVLLKIGFQLFSGPSGGRALLPSEGDAQEANVAFMPLAMPIMFGPGAIATTLGMTSLARHSGAELASYGAIAAAMLATMFVTYLCLLFARNINRRLGAVGVDALTRIVGFFVAAMGGGLAFHGAIEAIRDFGAVTGH